MRNGISRSCEGKKNLKKRRGNLGVRVNAIMGVYFCFREKQKIRQIATRRRIRRGSTTISGGIQNGEFDQGEKRPNGKKTLQ